MLCGEAPKKYLLLYGSGSGEARDDRLVSFYGLVDGHLYFGVEGEEEVDAGAEFDEAHFAALGYGLAFAEVVDDAAGYGAGDLADEDFTSWGGQHYGGALVVGAGFGVPGHEVFAGMIAVVADLAGYGVPVDVYVEGRHEDADLEAFALEVLGFFGFFDDHYFAVGGGVDEVVVGGGYAAAGVAEKLDDEEEEEGAGEQRPAQQRGGGKEYEGVEAQQRQQYDG